MMYILGSLLERKVVVTATSEIIRRLFRLSFVHEGRENVFLNPVAFLLFSRSGRVFVDDDFGVETLSNQF